MENNMANHRHILQPECYGSLYLVTRRSACSARPDCPVSEVLSIIGLGDADGPRCGSRPPLRPGCRARPQPASPAARRARSRGCRLPGRAGSAGPPRSRSRSGMPATAGSRSALRGLKMCSRTSSSEKPAAPRRPRRGTRTAYEKGGGNFNDAETITPTRLERAKLSSFYRKEAPRMAVKVKQHKGKWLSMKIHHGKEA
jgi:hypothetical protein